MTETPDLPNLLQDSQRVAEVPTEAIPSFLCQLGALQSALAARLVSNQYNGNKKAEAQEEGDRLLTVEEAAQKLGVSEDWLYRRAKALPFTVRLGPRQLRFSSKGIDRYIRQRQGR